MKTDVNPQEFFDELPLPLLIKDKIKKCCTQNIISDVINRILTCNVWLASSDNYHEDSVRGYRVALENICDDLLPYVMKKSGF